MSTIDTEIKKPPREILLRFRVPLSQVSPLDLFHSVMRFAKTRNSVRLSRNAKNSLFLSGIDMNRTESFIELELTVLAGPPVGKYRYAVPESSGKVRFLNVDAYDSKNWRKGFLRKIGRFQISGPRL